METRHSTFPATIRTDPATKAIDPRLAEEVQATNAAFDTTTKALERESVQRNSTAPIQIARFDA
jgi:hypothetical protein